MTHSHERTARVMDLFETYYKRVFLFARQSLPPTQAEDIAQEVFFRLMKLKNLERQSISVSYLLKIADNLIKRRYSRTRRFARYVEECAQHHNENEGGSTRDDTSASRSSSSSWDDAAIERAFSRLSGEEQDAINLIVCQGMSYEDAAYSLGVPTSTINNWKFRGLQKLRDTLHDEREPAATPGRISTSRRSGREYGHGQGTTAVAARHGRDAEPRSGRAVEPKKSSIGSPSAPKRDLPRFIADRSSEVQ